jgi:hypothetical protein
MQNVRHWKSHYIGKAGKALYFVNHKQKSGVNDSKLPQKSYGSPY